MRSPIKRVEFRIGPVKFEYRRRPSTDGEERIVDIYRTGHWATQFLFWRGL